MVPDRHDAARVRLVPQIARGEHATLGDQPLDLHEGVVIVDRIPNHQHPKRRQRLNCVLELRRRQVQRGCELQHLRVDVLRVAIQELGRAMPHVPEIPDLCPNFATRCQVVLELGVLAPFVVFAFAVDVRSDAPNR